jgi:hypothetical protein
VKATPLDALATPRGRPGILREAVHIAQLLRVRQPSSDQEPAWLAPICWSFTVDRSLLWV